MKYILSFFSLCFAVLIFWAMSEKSVFDSGALFFSEPWGIVALADLYLGFFIFSIFVFKAETNKIYFIFWTTALLLLGNLVAAVYTALFLFKKRELLIK